MASDKREANMDIILSHCRENYPAHVALALRFTFPCGGTLAPNTLLAAPAPCWCLCGNHGMACNASSGAAGRRPTNTCPSRSPCQLCATRPSPCRGANPRRCGQAPLHPCASSLRLHKPRLASMAEAFWLDELASISCTPSPSLETFHPRTRSRTSGCGFKSCGQSATAQAGMP